MSVTWDQSISASMHVIDCVKRLIPGPITASVPYGLTKWEEDLGSVRGLYLETGLQSLAGPKKGIYEQETGSTKYQNINTACQMARGQRLQATSGKLQAPSRKLDKIEL